MAPGQELLGPNRRQPSGVSAALHRVGARSRHYETYGGDAAGAGTLSALPVPLHEGERRPNELPQPARTPAGSAGLVQMAGAATPDSLQPGQRAGTAEAGTSAAKARP